MPKLVVATLVHRGQLARITLTDGADVLRSTAVGSLEQHAARLDDELTPIFAALGDESAPPQYPPDVVQKAGLLAVARVILSQGWIGYGSAADLYVHVCEAFMASCEATFGVVPPQPASIAVHHDVQLCLLLRVSATGGC